jgi:hypothetical protein
MTEPIFSLSATDDGDHLMSSVFQHGASFTVVAAEASHGYCVEPTLSVITADELLDALANIIISSHPMLYDVEEDLLDEKGLKEGSLESLIAYVDEGDLYDGHYRIHVEPGLKTRLLAHGVAPQLLVCS